MSNRLYSILVLIFVLSGMSSRAQTISVGMPIFEDYYRRAQLLGNFDENISFTVRPLFSSSSFSKNIFDPEGALSLNRNSGFDGLWDFGKGKGVLKLLPVSILNQYNSHHPEGINDGAMIPARGFQTMISAGLYVKYGRLSIQLRPEFVSAQNKTFEGFPQNYTSSLDLEFPSSPYGGMDFPERFGTGAYTKVFWGQSSFRLKAGPISFGVSNENLWWGPGYRNSLLMTNSAAGFKHVTLNTVRPIKTWIGSFEGQMIGGKLEESGYTENLREDWRYLNAMVVSYQPKWVPGLFLGATRSFLIYSKDMGNGVGDYLPVISFLSKSSGGSNEEVDAMGQDQLISVFMRYLFKEAHGEIYFEYGREDHSWDLRDFILEPAHSSAYILGLRKLFLLNHQKETYLQLIVESIHLAGNQTTIRRNPYLTYGMWYLHHQIRHGYTNQGQLLGAGIGPGSNLQTADISWVKSLKQIGITLERYVHDNDFWYNYVEDVRANWVDMSATAYGSWDYHNLLFTFKLKYIKSYNYQWMYEPDYGDNPPTFWAASENTHNFHGQLGIMYRF